MNLDVAGLGSNITALSVHNIRKADLKKLSGLDQLPLEGLELRWLSAASLDDIPLPQALKWCRIWHSSKLKDLSGIERLQNLEELDLRETGQPTDLSALSHLPSLRVLRFEGGYGTGQKLVSLAPIEGLKIEQLTLKSIDGEKLDLRPVARLPKLENLDLTPPNFAPASLAKIAAAKPWFLEQLLDLETAEDAFADPCKKCGTQKKILFLKRKKWLWCADCESTQLNKHLDGFKHMVQEAQGSFWV